MPQTILITGASSGIGQATALLFHDRGWNVVATMRTPERETELAGLDRVLVTRLDVTDGHSIDEAVGAGIDRFGRIDALMNNAGFAVYGPLEATSKEQIDRQFETNVIGLLETTKAVLPHFRSNRSGIVVNISSVGGFLTFPLGTLYHGTKFAIEGLSEALHYELSEIGVRMKIVQPGDTLTDFSVEWADDESIDEYREIVRKFPDGYAPIKAQGSEPVVVAEKVWEAVTDGTDRLRYPAGHDTIAKSAKRKAEDDETFIGDIRDQFALR